MISPQLRLVPILLATVPLSAREWEPQPLGRQDVVFCPAGSVRAATNDPGRPWVCVLTARRRKAGIDCPANSEPVQVANPYDPFQCALIGIEPRLPTGVCPHGMKAIPSSNASKPFQCVRSVTGPPALNTSPRCPQGSHVVATPNAFREFRCEPGPTPRGEPRPTSLGEEPASGLTGEKKPPCPRGTRPTRTENPFDPFQCVPERTKHLEIPAPADYTPFRIPGEATLEYPRSWHLADHWLDDLPTLNIQLDLERDGKPLLLTLTRYRKSSGSYRDLKSLIWQEMEWHGARETLPGKVSGLKARFLIAPQQSRTAFIEVSDGFFVVAYSAPSDLFQKFSPVYDRFLQSLRLLRR